jgi:hypothetical protein
MRPASYRSATWKHAVVLSGMLLMFGASGALLEQVLGISSPWMALMGMLCFMGIARAAEPLYPLKLPACLGGLRSWEISGAVYRALAVPAFGRCLRDTPLRFLNTSLYFSPSRPDPLAIRRQAESAEAIHFWAAVLLLPYMLFCAVDRQWSVVGWFALVQVLGNVYPIMHLRLVRARLDRTIARAIRSS